MAAIVSLSPERTTMAALISLSLERPTMAAVISLGVCHAVLGGGLTHRPRHQRWGRRPGGQRR